MAQGEEGTEHHLVLWGRIYPERAAVDLDQRKVKFVSQITSKVDGTLEYKVCQSQVICRMKSLSQEAKLNLKDIRNLVTEAIGQDLNALGITIGRGYLLEIQGAVDPISEKFDWQIFGVDFPALLPSDSTNFSRLKDFPNLNAKYENILKALGSDNKGYLRQALADFKNAILYPKDLCFYLYRAIESLCNSFLQDGETNKTSSTWMSMHDTLGTKSEEIKIVADFAKYERHGNHQQRGVRTDEDGVQSMKIAVDVLEKYVDWRNTVK